MSSNTVSGSGCPRQAAGPLTAALVVVLSAVGLGCASATPPPAPPEPAAVAIAAPAAADDQYGAIALADDDPPTPGSAGTTSATRRAQQRQSRVVESAPEPPVVSATPPRVASTRGDQPVRVVVDTLDIDVRVVPTGVAADGSMELPDTIQRAGWYRFSALPGSPVGSTVVAAHVDTVREGLGPFAALADSRRGDRVTLVDRGGDRHSYRVTSRRHIERSRLPVADLFDLGGPPRLVLITCGGAYDARNGYRDNVVVLAEPDQ